MALRVNFPFWLITCSLVVAAGCGDPDAGDADIDADVMDDADLRADAEVVDDDADLDDEGDGGYDGDVHHDADVDSDVDEFVDADADEDHEVAPPAASIGPEGGEVSLPDGTTLVVRPDAMPEEVEFTITEAEPEPTPWDEEGFVRVGPSFKLLSPVYSEIPFVLKIPAKELPEGRGPEDVVLVASSDGISDEEDEDGQPIARRTRIHPAWSQEGSDGSFALFETPATSPTSTYQAVVLGELPPEMGAPRPIALHWNGVGLTGTKCSAALEGFIEAPPDIDKLVDIETNFAKSVSTQWEKLADNPDNLKAFANSLSRFAARACYATYRAHRYYTEEMGFWLPDKRVTVTLQWSHESCKTLAHASGEGVSLFVNPYCWSYPPHVLFLGYVPANMDEPEAPFAGWNLPTKDLDTHTDRLETTSAHELFHYMDDWANLRPGDNVWDLGGTGDFDIFTEGGAVAAAEEVFDDAPGALKNPIPLWEGNFFNHAYWGHPFWRYLDWHQLAPTRDGSPMKRILERVRGRALATAACDACPAEHIEWEDLTAVVTDMYGPTADLDRIMGDFAAHALFIHGFERVTDESAIADRYPDAVGQTSDEEGPGGLWGPSRYEDDTGFVWTINPTMYRNTDPTAGPLEVIEFPMKVGPYKLNPLASRMIILEAYTKTVGDDPFRMKISAAKTSGGSTDDIEIRLFERTPDAERVTLIESKLRPPVHGVHSHITANVLLGRDAGHKFPLLVHNTDYNEEIEVYFEFEEITETGLVMGSFEGGIDELSIEAPAKSTMSACGAFPPDLGDTQHTDIEPVYFPIDELAVTYPYTRELRFFRRDSCSEMETVSFGDTGAGPIAAEMTPDGRWLVVATADPRDACVPGSVAIVDPATKEIVADVELPMGAGDMTLVRGPVGLEALVTQTGDSERCFSSMIRMVHIDTLLFEGRGASPDIIDAIIISGWGVGHPTRVDRTCDGAYAAWITNQDNGVVAIMEAATRRIEIFETDDPLERPWERPQDVAIVHHDGGVRAYFILLHEASAGWDPWVECLDALDLCSALRFVQWYPETGAYDLSGERTIPHSSARRLAINPSKTALYIGYSNRSSLTVFTLGTGALELLVPHPVVPELPTVPSPIAFYFPDLHD